MSKPGLLEAAPFGLRLVIQPQHTGLVYEEKQKWYLAIEDGNIKKPWRKVLGAFSTRAAAQKEAQRLGFGSVIYRSQGSKRWTRVSLHPERNWHKVYTRHRA
jgi:hypothetical protein